MLSSFELNLSVAPANVKPLLDPVPVWGGAVVAGAPLQVGVKPFQSMQLVPWLSARLPSASSKPLAVPIGPLASPQSTTGAERIASVVLLANPGKSEPNMELELESESRAACLEAREAR